MKLRIKGDSLRLRLTQGEVAALASTGRLSDSMRLAGGCLTYRIDVAADATSMSARLLDSTLTVALPDTLVQSWATTDEVSLSGQDGPLRLLIEKDFSCLKPREGEDDFDAYPHPDKGC